MGIHILLGWCEVTRSIERKGRRVDVVLLKSKVEKYREIWKHWFCIITCVSQPANHRYPSNYGIPLGTWNIFNYKRPPLAPTLFPTLLLNPHIFNSIPFLQPLSHLSATLHSFYHGFWDSAKPIQERVCDWSRTIGAGGSQRVEKRGSQGGCVGAESWCWRTVALWA